MFPSLRSWAQSSEHDAIVGKLDVFLVHKRRRPIILAKFHLIPIFKKRKYQL